MIKNDVLIQSQPVSLKALENQVGQLSNSLNLSPQGAIPSDTENARSQGEECWKAITLRNGIQLDENSKQDFQFKRILDVLNGLHINIPLVEASDQIPNYVKLMNHILSKKRRFGEFETVVLIEGCTAMLMNKLPPKLKEPGV
ncbi:reverse transcriptase [Gossypium australe]|uniref:Reverse transcriptase n=1 Tax=Gossypium australe TaxID=47621 RepID=A0A5B6VB94_9ROSI|nr:reverse transcriptase [Gossypium australe]